MRRIVTQFFKMESDVRDDFCSSESKADTTRLMVNQRDTSISKLLLLPDPSRSPKIERRNDLFVNTVSTLIERREREHGRVVL